MSDCNKPLSLCKTYKREKFWLDDFSQLYKNNNFVKFFPRYEMSRTEQMNSVSRLLIYFIIIVLLFNKNQNWLYLPITGLVLIIILHNVNKFDDGGKKKELNRTLRIRGEERDALIAEENRLRKHDGEDNFDITPDTEEENKPKVEVGYLDSENNIVIGPKYDPPKYMNESDSKENLYTIDELVDYRKNTCKRPTKDNPFMNTTLQDYNENVFDAQACNVDDDDIKDNMRVNFNRDLFMNVSDIFEKKNSQRQFYTTPNTSVPNKQVEFAQFLYGLGEKDVCKSYGASENCLRFSNLRYSR